MFSLPRKDKLSSILDDTQSLPFIVRNRTHYISMTKMIPKSAQAFFDDKLVLENKI